MSDYCGTPYGYTLHVGDGSPKCLPCQRAHADANRGYEVRRYLNRGPLMVDATGTRRRIQALAAMGWSTASLGRRLGVEGAAVRQWTYRRNLHPSTAEKVVALYDELWDQAGPNPRTAFCAKAAGWPPPMAWDDDEIDDPDAFPPYAPEQKTGGGSGRNLEREARVLELSRAGVSVPNIAARLRCNERYVHRVRARFRMTTPRQESA